MSTPTQALSAAGVSIWLDDLSRQRITTGNLQELIDSHDVVPLQDGGADDAIGVRRVLHRGAAGAARVDEE